MAPDTTVAGAVRAARELPIEIILVGNRPVVEPQLARYLDRPSNVSILHASETIGMDEPPVASIRKKKDSSINFVIAAVREGKADAFVSAGNT